jgi:hypothetical protein
MENALQAILDSVPPRRRRSKLEPYAALIRGLRARGRSYREIVTILRERCGLHVAMHTVYHFVRARGAKHGARHPPRRQPSEPVPSSLAVRRHEPAPAAEKKAFEYDENEPLQLIPDHKPRRR